MGSEIQRETAIRIICQIELSRMTGAEREEQLNIMLCEDWESHDLWNTIPPVVQNEFAEIDEVVEPKSGRYDPILLIWLFHGYRASTNEYLLQRLRELGHQYEGVTGEPDRLESCPCCGYRTIDERDSYEVCPVCYWEDDGQDNEQANEVFGGPNGKVSLTRARFNYLTAGVFDPARDDLRQLQDPPTKYARGRVFELQDDPQGVSERSAQWRGFIGHEECF